MKKRLRTAALNEGNLNVKSKTSVMFARKASKQNLIWMFTKEFILEKSHTDVKFVIEALFRKII